MSNPEDLSKDARMNPMLDLEEINTLAEIIVESDRERLDEMEDPLANYAQEMKMRWQKDEKSFRKSLIDGYKVLLEKITVGD